MPCELSHKHSDLFKRCRLTLQKFKQQRQCREVKYRLKSKVKRVKIVINKLWPDWLYDFVYDKTQFMSGIKFNANITFQEEPYLFHVTFILCFVSIFIREVTTRQRDTVQVGVISMCFIFVKNFTISKRFLFVMYIFHKRDYK